jgi:hypothetical protein
MIFMLGSLARPQEQPELVPHTWDDRVPWWEGKTGRENIVIHCILETSSLNRIASNVSHFPSFQGVISLFSDHKMHGK